MALATSHPPVFAPGRGWSYSNTGYILLGMVIEGATGHTLADELRGRILDPLDSRARACRRWPRSLRQLARGYLLRGNGVADARRQADVTRWNPVLVVGGGRNVSNVADLGRFYSALLRGELVPPERLREMKATVPGFSSDEYGLGIQRIAPVRDRMGSLWRGPARRRSTAPKIDCNQTIVMVNTSVAPGRLAFHRRAWKRVLPLNAARPAVGRPACRSQRQFPRLR